MPGRGCAEQQPVQLCRESRVPRRRSDEPGRSRSRYSGRQAPGPPGVAGAEFNLLYRGVGLGIDDEGRTVCKNREWPARWRSASWPACWRSRGCSGCCRPSTSRSTARWSRPGRRSRAFSRWRSTAASREPRAERRCRRAQRREPAESREPEGRGRSLGESAWSAESREPRAESREPRAEIAEQAAELQPTSNGSERRLCRQPAGA